MIVRDEHLNGLVCKGDDFEQMIHSLIRAEAWVCGIAPDQINWDYRTSVGDGGRDVMILVGNRRSDRPYIPSVKSVWSAKSGQDGLKPATLEKEVRRHPKVIAHLQEGGAYVWCVAPPQGNNDRDEWFKKRSDLANEFRFAEEQIHFFFRDTLTAWLNQHLGLIAIHLPNLPRGWKSLAEWKRLDRNRHVAWVEFGDRGELVAEIRQHLLATAGNNMFHLAGWSGIGKTRTALQACEDETLEGVLYFPTLDIFKTEFEDHITRSAGVRAAIVIDEVSIDEFSALQVRLSDFQHCLRVLTIGAGTSKSIGSREGVKEVLLPDSVTDVTRVIQSADSTLTNEQAQNLASWCDHDLRLALLLTDANKRDPGLAKQPITSVDDVWQRVTTLFERELGNSQTFRDHYEILSLCMDVGNQGEKRSELEHLAKYFGKPVAELERAISQACSCGLGRQQGRFFEAAPRALARRVFERWGLARIQNNSSQFLAGLPTDRLQRRLIERIQECGQATREEAVKGLKDWLPNRFSVHDIALISDHEGSRVFANYTETDPHRGLLWLRQAVEKASPEQLLAFDCKSDFSGGWRGRRQVVWICQHLAQFTEHFWDCEAILFRLAQYETEDRVANNSLRVWQSLFLPLLSNTPLPFDERWQHLMKRLSRATNDQLPLITEAAMNGLSQSLDDWVTNDGLPQIVGGRSVPPMWAPSSGGELFKIASAIALQFIEQTRTMPIYHQKHLKLATIKNISTFVPLGCLETLREWLAPQNMTDEELRQLRLSLDHYIHWLNLRAKDHPQWDIHPQDYEKDWAGRALEHVSPWRQALEPQSLEDRIRDITGRSSWNVMDNGTMRNLDVSRTYEELATEVLNTPQVLDDYDFWQWFNNDKAISSYEFGQALGKLDLADALQEPLLQQLAKGLCINLVAGYFNGLYWHRKRVPEPLVETLDSISDSHPEIAIFVTLRADISEAGFQRLLRSVPRAKPGAYSWLEELRWGQVWPQLMSAERQATVMALLAEAGESGESGQPQAYDLALEIICQWTPVKVKLPALLADVVLPILIKSLKQTHTSIKTWHWVRTVGMLPDSHLAQKIDLLIEAFTTNISIRRNAQTMLSEIARLHPDEVAEAVEAKIQDADHQDFYLLGNLLSLFDSNHSKTVQRLVRKLGVVGARALARHLSAPYPTADDPIYVPPMTAWLLNEFADDDQVFGVFCAGCHSGQMFVGGWGRYFVDTEQKVAPYLNHPLRRIREWAQDEINYAKGMIEWDNQIENERGRT